MDTSLTINDKEFRLIRTLVYDRFGINLTEQKRSLVVGRLQKLLRDEGFVSFGDYYDRVIRDTSGSSLDKLVNRISTNYTYFNREHAHFDFFVQEVLPPLIARLKKQNTRDLRIWSAGCSSGEEPYMLALLMMEYLGNDYGFWDGGVLATDISDQVLSLAKQGVYGDDQVARIPAQVKYKYFARQKDGVWLVNDALKKQVTYRRFNLMNKQFPFKSPFQVIFCRNVMIYFDSETRDALVNRFHQFLEPGGYLFIGHSETLGRKQETFQYVMPAVYRRI
ncbi:MAG: protein-glutamate O-methyltransferase CheR [Desulfobulbaceae bacterium]|nr:protein-glutamate O-methyltransferase CheR [Desulfobulbaceae bacterium]HIJ89995.1 protein-glutamate O-methyltransferase CheR [Deltaproteobacteria bacterium]